MDEKKYLEIIKTQHAESFEILKNFLIESNNKFNLTSIIEEKEIYLKHFLDSVMGESYFPQNATVAEVGSGGGFPSLPLKIVREDLSFLLIESTAKKCAYLDEAVDKLKLSCVKVFCGRAEDAAREVMHREKYDVAEARAVARLNTLAEYCMPLIKVGGRFISYKGDCDEEIKEAERAITVLGGEIEKAERYTLGGDKRTLVIVKKIKPTPQKYPRGQGRERKNPIV